MGLVISVIRRHGIGILALLVALSGTAYAANRIGAQDIKRNAIRSRHIKGGQVKFSDLAGGIRRVISSARQAPEQLEIRKVDGPRLFLAPGQFDGTPIAQCPAGYVVVGTGFSAGVGEPGFVLAYGTFVGGFFANFSSIETETYVQAICARNSAGGATTSRASAMSRFKHDVARARLALQE